MAIEKDMLERYGARLINARLHRAEGTLEVCVELDDLLDVETITSIASGMEKAIGECRVQISARLSRGREADSDSARFLALLSSTWAYYSPLMRPVLKRSSWSYDGERAVLIVPEQLYQQAEKYNGAKRLEDFMRDTYGFDIRVTLRSEALGGRTSPDGTSVDAQSADEQSPDASFAEKTQFDMPSIEAPAYAAAKPSGVEQTKPAKASKKPEAKAARKPFKVPLQDIIMGTPKSTKPVAMNLVAEDSGTVTVCGSIFSIDVRDRKNGGFIVNMAVTDKTNTLSVKFFPEAKEKKRIERLQAIMDSGDWLVVHGRYQRDEFTGFYCIFADVMYRVDAVRREDTAEEKRVELHLHTKMSAMDGFIDAAAAVNTAARWGHKAIAITDHGVVQAFPAAVAAANKLKKKGKNIKVLMGVEGYLLPDAKLIPMEGEFVSLDAVMGEGAYEGQPFALSAVRSTGERFFALIDSGVPVPQDMRKKWGLPESMAGQPTFTEALVKLEAFLRGATIVTHDSATLLTLYRRASDANISFPRESVCVDTLVHDSHRDKPTWAPTTPGECFAAMGIAPPNSAEEGASSLYALFTATVELMRSRGITRLPLWDSVPQEKVKGKRSTYHIILIAKNVRGLKNLYKLVSYAHIEHLKGVPRIPRSLLLFHRDDIIVGSACEAGELFRAVLEKAPHEEIVSIAKEYDYLEVQPIGNNEFLMREGIVRDREGLRDLNREIVALARELDKPVVATGDAHFLEKDDSIYRAIVMSARDFKDAEQQAPLYFRTTDDMLEEFSYMGEDVARELVIENPNKIADMCESMMPFLSEKSTYSPEFENASETLENMAMKRAHEIYGEVLPAPVDARLKKELGSIIGNGYASLYLSAQMLVHKSNSDGYLVGSRGSVGSSFVATMAGITEVNPLTPHYVCPKCQYSEFDVDTEKYFCGVDLPDKDCPKCGAKLDKLGYTIPFEVFLGFKGDKTPDIDLNFSGEYQPEAHKYVEVMFGEGHAFRAGTISGLKDKTVYGYIKGFTEEHSQAFSRAETDRLAKGCEGVKRTTGQHPGGIIIVPDGYEIFDFTPIQFPADKSEKNTYTTHFDFHAMDDRLVKLDILGHDDPTALRMLKDITGVEPKEIPLDDPETMRIFSSIEPLHVTLEELNCDVGTVAIPEFGTNFVRRMLMDTRPTTMEELVRISGLSHGTDVWTGNAQDMVLGGIARLNEVICTRDDIMNNLIARGEEPSVAFKTMESVRKGRGLSEEHEAAMRAVDTPDWFIQSCHKIKYLFPRAHAAAYVMMAFRVAFYKVHHPEAFYAVYFTARADAFDVEQAIGGEETVLRNINAIRSKGNKAEQKEQDLLVILEVVYEMNRRNIELLPIDLEKSDATRFGIEGHALRPPFSAIAGVGMSAAIAMGEACKAGRFTSVEDFKARSRANSGVVDKLRMLGCFDNLPESDQITLF